MNDMMSHLCSFAAAQRPANPIMNKNNFILKYVWIKTTY